MEGDNGVFVRHISCVSCGSTDANALYSSGQTYCFSCGKVEKGADVPKRKYKKKDDDMDLLDSEYKQLSKRKIPLDICRKYGYGIGKDKNGVSCQIANYYNSDKQIVAQKLRYPDKTFKFIGESKEATMFGMNLWGNKGKKIVITEGEIDTLSVATAFGGKYPVVSLKNGANASKRELSKFRDYFEGYEEIYFWFDNDDVGNKYLAECIDIFSKEKIRIIKHETFKDASDVLVNLGTAGIINCFYNATEYKPDYIDTPSDLIEQVNEDVKFGFDWCYKSLTNLTYGRRFGEIVTLGAGVSCGKTDFINTQIAFDIKQGYKVGTFMLEQPSVQTLLRVAGKIDGVQYHIPNKVYDKEVKNKTIAELNGKLFMYNSFGSTDSDKVINTIKYMFHNHGVKIFYIDNLTSLTAGVDDERRHLDNLMAELAGVAFELNVWILAVSHLNPPKKGASHETGGKVEQSQFTGSRAIMRWSWLMLGIERNTLHEDPVERCKSVIRVVKDRYIGTATGHTVSYRYDVDTGLCLESEETFDIEADEDDEDKDY